MAEIISEEDVLHRIQDGTITVSARLSREDIDKITQTKIVETPDGEMSEFDFIPMAVDKQIPRKPALIAYGDNKILWGTCACGRDVGLNNIYCSKCGQRMDWGNEK